MDTNVPSDSVASIERRIPWTRHLTQVKNTQDSGYAHLIFLDLVSPSLYGKTYQTVTIWTAFLVTGMKNFHTEPPYGDKCHRMKAWYEEFIPVTIWKFHTKMVTDMNIIHMVTYHMVTYSYWYENEYFFQMVTCSDGDINDFNGWMIFFSDGDKFIWWQSEIFRPFTSHRMKFVCRIDKW